MTLELALLPTAVLLARRPRWLAGLIALALGTAELGRRRAHGEAVFPATTSWFAPAWLAERALYSWLAVAERMLHGGVQYSGGRLRRAAHSISELSSDS
jgi:hypothetical protein